MIKVLLIDDDIELTGLLEEYLSEEGLQTKAVNEGRIGIEEAASGYYDLVVLDIMMPRMNGIEVLQRIRKSSDIPILMLSARGDNIDRITGLNLGADDYLQKPCSPSELVARIRAILRRTKSLQGNPETHILQSGSLKLFPRSRSAEWQGAALELTGTEFNLLEVLVKNAGQIVAKNDLSKIVFGHPLAAYDRRIDVHISSIRQKLGYHADGQSWIRSIRGMGYQLIEVI
ncbi:response regulator transcription factor [Microvirga sp. W0021]|uniref:Response regulator transcription factor n=1 Tax=Hohaiivirga grylli TaxID=3133970 RepID=A0ABV0BF42_9HYPH